MTRALLIGNSHAAMVIAALRARGGAGPSFDFLTQPGDGPEGVEIAGGEIRAVDPDLAAFLAKTGAPDRFALADYDFILILGCGLSFYQAMPLLRNAAVWGWPSAMGNTRRRAKPGMHLISAECYAAGLRARMEETLAARLHHALAASCAGRIVIAPQPRPSARLLSPDAGNSMFRRATRDGDGERIAAAFDAALAAVFPDALILRQAEETVDRALFTHARFMEGATRLSAPGSTQDETDVLHANALYGEILIQSIEDIFSKTKAR